MPYGEADPGAELIDPALHARGWAENLIRRDEIAGDIEMMDGLDLCAVLIGGVCCQDVVKAVMLGLSSDGRTHALGLTAVRRC